MKTIPFKERIARLAENPPKHGEIAKTARLVWTELWQALDGCPHVISQPDFRVPWLPFSAGEEKGSQWFIDAKAWAEQLPPEVLSWLGRQPVILPEISKGETATIPADMSIEADFRFDHDEGGNIQMPDTVRIVNSEGNLVCFVRLQSIGASMVAAMMRELNGIVLADKEDSGKGAEL